MTQAPVLVEIWRGGRVESRHRGHAVAMNSNGRVLHRYGDIDAVIYPRSAIKPFQALPLIETGAAAACNASEAEIAVACASHRGEALHVDVISHWLSRCGLGEEHLGCGPHLPNERESAHDLIRASRKPGRIHNNCSGKHTGMLAVALHCGEPVAGYLGTDHPLQLRIKATLESLSGEHLAEPPGIDGCGAPNWPMPLRSLALAAARFGAARTGDPRRDAACRQIARAMQGEPVLVSGQRGCCTAIMQAVPNVIAKTGAEGVYMLASTSEDIGIALKIEDGATRASQVLAIGMLQQCGLAGTSHVKALARFAAPVLKNFSGEDVGRISLARDWPQDEVSDRRA